jgi:DNA polymerase I
VLELLRHKDDHEFFPLMMEYRRLSKLASTYGVGWFKDSYINGRVYPSWWQLGATTGRMACSSPNLQQLPNAGPYRSCIRAPEGRTLVIADYSQIELRIAAKIAPDKSMLETFRRGEVDIHTETAQILTGKETPTKLERSKAKVINFGLLYGMSRESLPDYALKEYGLAMTNKEASTFYKKYFQVRKGLKSWHRRIASEFFENDRALTMRTLIGRVPRDITNLNEVLNHPVQGTGADGLKLALVMLHEDRDRYPTAVPIIAAHDEIVYECDEGEAEGVKGWVEDTMKAAMDEVVNAEGPEVPIEVEGVVSREWVKP